MDEIQWGIRGTPFATYIKQLLLIASSTHALVDHVIANYMSDYEQAFTHVSADRVRNYEVMEWMGDSILNQTMAIYLYDRFSTEVNTVSIFTRLKINHISKNTLSSVAHDFGMTPYISATRAVHYNSKTSLHEDVLEAFYGCTYLIWRKLDLLVSPMICYELTQYWMDSKTISTDPEDLYDPITRLKELCDYFSGRDETRPKLILRTNSECRAIDDHHHRIYLQGQCIGESRANKKAKAQTEASRLALIELKLRGYEKPRIIQNIDPEISMAELDLEQYQRWVDTQETQETQELQDT